jgi:hypothetical protein
MQNPCFLEVTGRVALQNIENNEVPYKIFLAKELWDVSASSGSFRMEDGAKRTCWDDGLKEDFQESLCTNWGNYLQKGE